MMLQKPTNFELGQDFDLFYKKQNIYFYNIFFFIFISNLSLSQDIEFNSNIAYINFQYIYQNSNPSKELRVALNQAQKDYQSQILLEEELLNNLENDLEKKRSILDEESLKKLLSEFEKKIEITQNKLRISKQNLDFNFQNHQKKIADEINKLVKEFAKENEITMVFKSNNIIYADEKINLTSIILKEFNRKTNLFDFSNLSVKLFTSAIFKIQFRLCRQGNSASVMG